MPWDDLHKALGADFSQAIPVTKDDLIQFTALGNDQNSFVNIQIRILTVDGRIANTNDRVLITGSAAPPDGTTFRLTDGLLLLAGVGPYSPAGLADNPWVRIALIRGAATTTNTAIDLASGYLSLSSGVAWPNSGVVTPNEQSPFTLGQGEVAPAAGADINYPPARPRAIRLLAFSAIFTASAAVANRRPSFTIFGNAQPLWRSDSPAVVTAGQTARYWLELAPAPANPLPGDNFILIPDLGFVALLSLTTTTTNIQAADQWSTLISTTQRRVYLANI